MLIVTAQYLFLTLTKNESSLQFYTTAAEHFVFVLISFVASADVSEVVDSSPRFERVTDLYDSVLMISLPNSVYKIGTRSGLFGVISKF